MNDFFKNQTVIFYIFLAISIVLSRLPIIGKYFIGINTLIHETGHALMALFLSGKVHRIDLSSDTSGSALTSTDNKFKSFLVSIIGYPFSSIIAFVFFYFIHQKAFDYVLFIIIGIALLNLILYVRNWYGIFWLLSFLGISVLIIYFKIEMLLFGFALFCSFIILSDSILSAIILLIISIKSPKAAGDANNLANLTHFPAVFWSVLFVAFSIFMGYKTIVLFFPYWYFITQQIISYIIVAMFFYIFNEKFYKGKISSSDACKTFMTDNKKYKNITFEIKPEKKDF